METYAIIPVSRFSNAKTRLSPTLNPVERENLLKSMLKDVIKVLKKKIPDVLVISADPDVLEYVEKLEVLSLKEEGNTDLNGALTQAVQWCSNYCSHVLIVPSDIPLIKEEHVQKILNKGEETDMVIAPAKGGGTNALLCPVKGMEMKFGDCSFFEHLKVAENNGFSYSIFDSFYLSLDVNTAEDLGEIIIHGEETETRSYLENLNLKVHSNHGLERLRVLRE
ncbi:MAG: 2-phospho-L-lactate guanylyltransferase [Methanobacterium sp.]|nr:2-phospho-L-lactate guanylyltransferase [Methanobacterium sp.]